MSSLLDLAAKMMESSSHSESSGPAAKRPRVEAAHELDVLETLAQSLFEIRAHVHDVLLSGNCHAMTPEDISAAVAKYEVEVRVGMLVLLDQSRRWKSQQTRNKCCIAQVDIGGQHSDLVKGDKVTFRAGVDEVLLEGMRRALCNSAKFQAQQLPPSRIRYDKDRNRWEVDSHSGLLVSGENKQRFYRKDLALLSHQYDIRIDAANECALAQQQSAPPASFVHERLKRRVCYRSKSRHLQRWKADVTEVDVSSLGKTAELVGKELEVELELEPEALRALLGERDQSRAIELIKELTSQLGAWLGLLVPHEHETLAPAKLLETLDCSAEVRAINTSLRRAVGNNSQSDGFLGSLPINMTRRNLLHVQRSTYHLTEKSDGVRYLLYVVDDNAVKTKTAKTATDATTGVAPVAVMQDRGKAAYRVSGGRALGEALGHGTVLDGELVFNRNLQDYVFLVFDVLAIDGSPVLQLPFSQRAALVADTVIPRYEHSKASPNPSPALRLLRKNFVDKGRVTDLLSRVGVEEGGERVFRDPSTSGHHRTDGFIFQPDSPYVIGCDSALLKWKWPELRSVDLEVIERRAPPGGELDVFLQLSCDSDDGTQVDCTKRGSGSVGLGLFDTLRLQADMQDFLLDAPSAARGARGGSSRRGRIAEVYYDASIGMWGYQHLRRDKAEPNLLFTVLGVFMEQADSIGVEELEYRLLTWPGQAENDFAARLGSMKQQLLDWKKKEIAKAAAAAAGKE